LIEKVCRAEGTEDGVATASGMAAMFGSIASLLQQGDHIMAARSLFGSTHQLLTRVFPKWGITSTYGNISDYQNWEKLLQPNTKMLFLETPSNPGLEIIDLEWAGKFAAAHNLILVVDNCFDSLFAAACQMGRPYRHTQCYEIHRWARTRLRWTDIG